MERDKRQQPIPVVTEADVERIVRRDFKREEVSAVLSLLKPHEDARWKGAAARVQLAVLKLANGDYQRAREFLRSAYFDSRDVLGPAEYPSYTELDANASEQDRERAIDEDWKQYTEWSGIADG